MPPVGIDLDPELGCGAEAERSDVAPRVADLAMRSAGASGLGDVAGQRPSHERVGVSMTHLVLRLEETHDGHVFVETTCSDDALPLRDRTAVLLFDGGEVRC